MSHEASSILDFIRPGGGLIVVKSDRLGGNTRGGSQPRARIGRKRSKPPGLEPAIDTGGPRGRMVLAVLGMVAEMVAWLYPRSATRGHRSHKAEGVYKGRPATFDRARIVSLRKEGMGAPEIAKAVLLSRVFVSRF
jgi:DNA invertase Pin-like site-specific DNA recombinase